jgi:hypothetical protein
MATPCGSFAGQRSIIAVSLTFFTYGLWEPRPSFFGHEMEQIQRGLSQQQVMELAIVRSVPAVWILVLMAGLGCVFSFNEHRETN